MKPGTEQWAKLSSKQIDEVCIIPNQVLGNLATKALLITCLNYPGIIDVFAADNLHSGFIENNSLKFKNYDKINMPQVIDC